MTHMSRPALALAALLHVSTAAAEVTVFEQPSDPIGGFLSDGSAYTVAEDFTLSTTASVGALVWWGGYGSPYLGVPERDGFTVRIFLDAGGAPGEVVATFTPGSAVSRQATGGWVNPPDANVGFTGRPEFEYRLDLPTPLVLQAGTRYWLSIIGVPNLDSWLWGASLAAQVDEVQRTREDPVAGPWEPYTPGVAFRLLAGSAPTDPEGEGPGADSDGDGVPDAEDRCQGTVIPERVPTVRLGVNRFALVDGDGTFDTLRPRGRGRAFSSTIADTHGCSCEQILTRFGIRGNGLWRFGCTAGILRQAAR